MSWTQHFRSDRYNTYSVGSELLTVVVTESCIFWDITPCIILKQTTRLNKPEPFKLRKNSTFKITYVAFPFHLFNL
jgi:hypothetical protein